MRERYQERLEAKLGEEKRKVLSTMIENSVLNKNTEGFQPVKMIFLTEKNAADSEWRISALDNTDSAFKIRHSEESELTPKDENQLNEGIFIFPVLLP